MSKRIKTNNSDIDISTTTIEVITINGFSFEHDEQLPRVGIYIISDSGKELYEEIEVDDVIDFEDLKRFAMNWYFNNVEIVKVVKKKCRSNEND